MSSLPDAPQYAQLARWWNSIFAWRVFAVYAAANCALLVIFGPHVLEYGSPFLGAPVGFLAAAALRRGHARRQSIVKRSLLIALVLASVIGWSYSMWASYRFSPAFFLSPDQLWPVGWPYPDQAIEGLSTWFDVRYPVPPDVMKIEGELQRMRMTASVVNSMLALSTGWWLGWLAATPGMGKSKRPLRFQFGVGRVIVAAAVASVMFSMLRLIGPWDLTVVRSFLCVGGWIVASGVVVPMVSLARDSTLPGPLFRLWAIVCGVGAAGALCGAVFCRLPASVVPQDLGGFIEVTGWAFYLAWAGVTIAAAATIPIGAVLEIVTYPFARRTGAAVKGVVVGSIAGLAFFRGLNMYCYVDHDLPALAIAYPVILSGTFGFLAGRWVDARSREEIAGGVMEKES